MRIRQKIRWNKISYSAACLLGLVYLATSLPVTAATCDRNAANLTQLNNEFSSATIGETICLTSSSSYGVWTGGNKAVTVTSADGATPTIQIDFNNGDGSVTIDNVGIVGGSIVNDVRDVTIKNSDFTGIFVFDNVYNSNILLDNNTHIDIPYNPMGSAGRLSFPYSNSTHSGVTIANSLFRGGSSDGVQTGIGVNIINNEFDSIAEEGDPLAHSDSIQLLGAYGSVVRGNYIHDGSTGVVAYDGVSNVLIENNVIGTSGRIDAVELLSDENSIVRHNTILGSIFLGHKPADDAGFGTVIDNNIASFISLNDGSTAASQQYNLLDSTHSDPTNINGTPAYIGGASPGAYDQFQLVPGSLGTLAASDGRDMGLIIDSENPTLTLASPSQNDTISGDELLTANATDDTAVYGVTFYRNGVQIGGEDLYAPYSVNLDTRSLSNGQHVLTAVARDAYGNSTTSVAVQVTVNNADVIERSLWSETDIPADTSVNDGNAVELGARFSTILDGYITGIRFYKSPDDVATSHTGSLWRSSDGAKLADVTFTNETASGWQEALFSSKVPVTAGTDYIVSYHNPTGIYATSTGYFSSAARVNRPLTAPQDDINGLRNGLYDYRSTPGLPTQTFGAANYWVDVVYEPLDIAPPVVDIQGITADQRVKGSIQISASASDNEQVVGVQFKRDCPNSCVNIASEDTTAPYETTFDTTALPDGARSITASARDASGNIADDTVAVVIDNTAPVATLMQTPPGSTSETSAQFTFSANEPSTFECSLDNAAFVPCSSPVTHSQLAVTSHSFRVKALDLAGNTQADAATFTWSITVAHPADPQSPTTPTKTTKPSISISSPAERTTLAVGSDAPPVEASQETAVGEPMNEGVVQNSEKTNDTEVSDKEADEKENTILEAVLTAAPYVTGGAMIVATGVFLMRRLIA